MLFAFITILLLLPYVLLLLFYRRAWREIPDFKGGKLVAPESLPLLTVIIPARNEEKNIGKCLQSIKEQHLPSSWFEVIVVDDHSDDDTAEIVQAFPMASLRIISLKGQVNTNAMNSYKKKAIEIAIREAKGELIVTTDADCLAGTQWLDTIAGYYQRHNPVFIAAPVFYMSSASGGFFNQCLYLFQCLDLMALQGITAAAVYKKVHNMCNGANLAYTKQVFKEVDGFEGINEIASGDDMLLMQKIQKSHPECIGYIKSRSAIVQTWAEESLFSFLHQRIRWASKWGQYKDWKITSALALVYLLNAWLLLLFLSSFFYFPAPWLLAAAILIKWGAEYFFLTPVARFFGKSKTIGWLLPFQPLHIIYTLVAGWLGKFGHYQWKGRTVK